MPLPGQTGASYVYTLDKLEPNSGGYQPEVTGSSGRFAMQFDLGADSRYLGVMKLAAAA